ncbi:MAG TPA: ATP-binding cassette domain-containing protein [Thermoanaerobaculia bacterium]|nr:ATP-binding cassette domain-containing protein [Thermoanaerobaculia bacterium]
MLDLAVQSLAFSHRGATPLFTDLSFRIPARSHAAIVGVRGSGKSTLLKLLAGDLKPSGGSILIGTREVHDLPRKRRPLLYLTPQLEQPARWSVGHLLVAAVRQRPLDREDRFLDLDEAARRWEVDRLLDRSLRQLSTSELARARCAQIELLRPGILIMERLLSGTDPSEGSELSDQLFRFLRTIGTTVVAEIGSFHDLGNCDAVLVLEAGKISLTGSSKHAYESPSSTDAARATGQVNLVPVTIRGTEVESPIGAWNESNPPFQGDGIYLLRPEHLVIAGKGEDSDFILAVEEAFFFEGTWHLRGFMSAGQSVVATAPASANVSKGKLLPYRILPHPRRYEQRPHGGLGGVPRDGVPSMRDSR